MKRFLLLASFLMLFIACDKTDCDHTPEPPSGDWYLRVYSQNDAGLQITAINYVVETLPNNSLIQPFFNNRGVVVYRVPQGVGVRFLGIFTSVIGELIHLNSFVHPKTDNFNMQTLSLYLIYMNQSNTYILDPYVETGYYDGNDYQPRSSN